jgi:hypothetical protein
MKQWLILAALLGFAASAHAADEPKRDMKDVAVERALRYLQRAQERDGSWTGGFAKNPAVTSLAVLAFLSAGYGPEDERYGEAIKNGVASVLSWQKANGLIATEGGHEMYHHGICTLMLASAQPRAKGKLAEEIDTALDKAIEVILQAQRAAGRHQGGWRYQMKFYDGDLSVSGWQLQALRAAKNTGRDVPIKSLEEAVDYIRKCRDPLTGAFRYFPESRITVPCTAVGIMALESATDKEAQEEMEKAGAYVLKNPPRWGSIHCFYGFYYCSKAVHQLGGNYWKDFQPKLHTALLDNQKDNGSWQGTEAEGRAYGLNYCTAMAVLALTVDGYVKPAEKKAE